MPGSRSSNDPDHKSPRESGEDSEDESEILEESPCGRWLKRREELRIHPGKFVLKFLETRDEFWAEFGRILGRRDGSAAALRASEGYLSACARASLRSLYRPPVPAGAGPGAGPRLVLTRGPHCCADQVRRVEAACQAGPADLALPAAAVVAPRNHQVEQRDVPGIDSAYLAMDTEEGVEVVWNEVQFSERRNFKAQEDKIQAVFDNLTRLEHPNIVKFHRYWTDTHNDKPRVIFITEYMSSGSLKQFLKRTKRNVKKLPLQAWKRWCTQILSALSYLHSCSPAIVHGNLTCDTIFIQHNGLVKIGSVAPDAIHHHVKTCRDNIRNMHFIAPEYGTAGVGLTPAADVYAFGMCALEMAALEIQGNGDSGQGVTEEHIRRTIDSLDDVRQRDFIRRCLHRDPTKRPPARDLLFHPLLFEVHPLRLLAAHALVHGAGGSISETVTEEVAARLQSPDLVLAEVLHPDGRPPGQLRLSDVPAAEKLEKFVEDVKFGIYPLTAYAARQPPPPRPRAISPELAESVKSVTPEPVDVENRRVVNMMCNVKPKDSGADLSMTLLLRMDDKMNRQLTCLVSELDSALLLAHELVHFGFINEADREKIATLIEDTLRTCFNKQLLSPTGNNGMSSATVPAQVIPGIPGMPVMPGLPGMPPMPGMTGVPGMPGVQSVVPGMPMMQTMPAMVPLQHMGPPPVTAPMTVPSSNAMLPPTMYPMPSHDHVSMAATVHSAGS